MNEYSATQLHGLEREAQRLRAEYAGDLIVRAAVGFDLAVRRLAYRLVNALGKEPGGRAHA